MEQMTARLSDTKDNYLHLQLLLQPCKTMESLTPASPLTEFADCIVELMHLIHIIWSHSEFYHKQENIDKLIKYVSNQVIMCCTKKVDLAKILTSQPRSGIKVCDIFITWCNIYKELVERVRLLWWLRTKITCLPFTAAGLSYLSSFLKKFWYFCSFQIALSLLRNCHWRGLVRNERSNNF